MLNQHSEHSEDHHSHDESPSENNQAKKSDYGTKNKKEIELMKYVDLIIEEFIDYPLIRH